MKKSNIIINILLVIIALVFTITISKIVPKDKFTPYILQLDSLWDKTDEQQEYLIDITGDKKSEIIRHHNINISGHSIEFQKDDKIHQSKIFEHGEKFIGKYLKFADIDNDSTQELIFISAQKFVAYLNILSYNARTKELIQIEQIIIDTLEIFNDEMDAINNFIITDGANIYFDLQGSYSIQPRHIYKYDFKKKILIKNKLNGLVTPNVYHFSFQNKNYLLSTLVKATSNTLSPKDAEMLRTSTDNDTLAMYEKYKHLEYEYGDFSSYILLYNDSLNFEFKPIEFFAWTNYTKATIVSINNTPHIFAFTNSQMNEPDHQKCKLVTVCNLQGEIIKQIPLPHDYTDIFSESKKVVFYGDKTLFITNENLDPINEIKNITYAHGYADIENDNKPEFVAFENNILKIYSTDFKINATFKIEQEFAPYPEEWSFTILQIDQQNSFIFNTRLFYYKFNYQKNNIAVLKYPFYFMIFLLSFGVLFLIFRLNSKRLEKENIKLEQIVKQRTKEIATQKEEIQTQAESLKIKNNHLIELSDFKKLMTGTIIHDLKNPLNHIINLSHSHKTNNKFKNINQAGKQMLNLVVNILDVAKCETNEMVLNITNNSLSKTSEDAINEILFLSEQKNIQINNNIEQHLSTKTDKEIIERVFVNILTNAIKYTPNNGEICINTKITDNNSIKIEISDTGQGIPQDKIHEVFDRFAQISAKKSGKTRSTGLGLTFCKMAIEAHGGKIGVESELEKGTTFWFLLPISKNSNLKENIKTDICKKDKLQLNKQEKNILKPYINKLQNLAIYEASEIFDIIEEIGTQNSKALNKWKDEITNAVISLNNKKYNELINKQ